MEDITKTKLRHLCPVDMVLGDPEYAASRETLEMTYEKARLFLRGESGGTFMSNVLRTTIELNVNKKPDLGQLVMVQAAVICEVEGCKRGLKNPALGPLPVPEAMAAV